MLRQQLAVEPLSLLQKVGVILRLQRISGGSRPLYKVEAQNKNGEKGGGERNQNLKKVWTSEFYTLDKKRDSALPTPPPTPPRPPTADNLVVLVSLGMKKYFQIYMKEESFVYIKFFHITFHLGPHPVSWDKLRDKEGSC